ncbi:MULTISPECIES: lysozyme inhibitor LprI family protein [Stutzerimonas]|uniref:lysozyme inhibitor LprI family protein n=1 Tax=Stutzerimonas TaxID=2901164 RepID=UPI00242001CB|nr:lysozyme inhibitor LprI family protein [Stutzerimonas kunmingensis]
MRISQYLTIIAAAAAFQFSVASEYSPSYTECMDASDGITVNMLNCNAAEMAQQDARLNHFYNVVRLNLDEPLSAQLFAAQRAWISFRDNDCGLLGMLTGGTMDALNGSSCFLEKTRARADDMQWLAESI